MQLTERLKALADENRLRILNLLDRRTLCVCDLEEVLGLQQSNLSRHLAKLKQVGLVASKKQGLFMYYRRVEASGDHEAVLNAVFGALAHESQFQADRKALEQRLGSCATC